MFEETWWDFHSETSSFFEKNDFWDILWCSSMDQIWLDLIFNRASHPARSIEKSLISVPEHRLSAQLVFRCLTTE